jgi:Uma2 family endonuclease
MGNLATPEALLARWEEALEDPVLRDLPYKIELNSWGKLEMTPVSNRRGLLCGELAAAFGSQLQGTGFIGCSIMTKSGIRTPDVAWASPEFMRAFGEMTPYTQAPEICVEVISEATTQAEIAERLSSYFAAGANEVWLVSEDGSIRYVGPAGDQPASRFPVTLTLPAPLKPAP